MADPRFDETEYRDDPEMRQILNTLRQLPVEPLPEGFSDRLHRGLQEEGAAIRAAAENPKETSRKLFYRRVGLALAACFMVGLISFSMYNNMQSNFQPMLKTADRSVKEESLQAAPETADISAVSSSDEIAKDYGSPADRELLDSGAQTGSGARVKADLNAASSDDAAYKSGVSNTSDASNASSESAAGDSDVSYKCLQEYLKPHDFEIISRRADVDTGEIEFVVRLILPAEATGSAGATGKDQILILNYKEGVIHEKNSQAPIGSD